jgi:hypothetical protein
MVSTVVLVAVAGMFLVTLVAATGSGRLAADFHASYLQAAQSFARERHPVFVDPRNCPTSTRPCSPS